jgi:hypothetical protein
MWTRHDSYDEMVWDAWVDNAGLGSGLQGVWDRLCGILGNMKSWSFEVFGLVCSQIKKTSGVSPGCKNPITSHGIYC